jgi:sugar transferase (PEP-CTERM/EpsH1 system associated)
MRVLVLTHSLPYAPNRGDRLRAYHMLQFLRQRADVELVSLIHDDEELVHVDDVRAFVPRVTALRVPPWRTRFNAATAMITHRPLTHALLDAPGVRAAIQDIAERRCPDVVFAYCSGMAKFALQPPLDRVPLVLDFVDIDSQKWRDLAVESRWPHSWIYRREAATLGAFEARAAAQAATSLVVNAREAGIARTLAPSASVEVLLNGVELERLHPIAPPAAAPRVIFCGVMNYAPNDEGMQWFVREVWPLIRARRADATLAIVGSDPTPALRTLCEGDASIAVTGRVRDVRDWLWESAVAIAPLRVARGVQNKALEAMAAGLPIVMTDAVAGGLPAEAMPAARVANTPEAFAEHLLDLLGQSPAARRNIAASGDLSALTWSRTLQPLWSILERAASSTPPPPQSAVAQMAWRSA